MLRTLLSVNLSHPALRPAVLALCAALVVWPGAAGSQTAALPSLGHAEGLSLGTERQLGDRIARELYRDPDYLEDPVLDEYLHRLWDPLVQAAERRGEMTSELRERFAWRIMIGRDRSINAFALPGGYLGVHLGLIAAVGSDDELASVLAHELSHVTQRHIARSIDDQARMTPLVIGSMILGALAAARSPQGAQALMIGGQAAALQQQLSYSRDMEREADRIGYGVLTEAGYDPRGFVGMFGRLQQASALNDNGSFPYLRSHPLTTERIADMQARQSLMPMRPAAAPDWMQSLMSARARVLSLQGPDALRTWAAEPEAQAIQSAAERAGRLYAAVLARVQLRDFEAARQALQALQKLVTGQTTAQGPEQVAAQRQVRLLQAELQMRLGDLAAAVQTLLADAPKVWPRPERMAIGQALAQLPGHPQLEAAQRQLREQVQRDPGDAQAWQVLAGVLRAQGQMLAALRAEGEAQVARMDDTGAVDRFRAAQDLARRGPLQPGDHIEASIVDSRLRETLARVRAQLEQQRQQR